MAQEPARFGIRETWQLDGDLLGTGLFYEESAPSKRGARAAASSTRRSIASRRAGALRRYPWAGALSTAHTVLHYDKFGPGVFRDRARCRPRSHSGHAAARRRRASI